MPIYFNCIHFRSEPSGNAASVRATRSRALPQPVGRSSRHLQNENWYAAEGEIDEAFAIRWVSSFSLYL